MSRKPIVIAALAGVAFASPALSAPQKPDLDQVGNAVEATLLELGERNALGVAGQPLSIRRPAQVRYELGAVVDTRDAAGGVRVMAVTPDSAAQRLGLKAGDRLLAVNNARLADRPDASAVLERALQAGSGDLNVRFARDTRTLVASGKADVAAIPAYTLIVGSDATAGCGYATTEFGVLPRDRGVFPALITQVDGRSTPLRDRPNQYRLDSGRHVLVVDETIDRARLGLTEQRYIALMQQRERQRAYKPLVIDVKPGVSYRIGARLIKDRLNRNGILANEYWEPVVWETKSERCD